MNFTKHPDLIASCERVHWYEPADKVLNTPGLYLQHVMSFGSKKDIQVAQKYYNKGDFIHAIETVSAGKFNQQRWDQWRDKLGLEPKRAPRRYEDDDSPLDWWRGNLE